MNTEERRAKPRYRSLKGAKLYAAEDRGPVSCIVRSLSAHGARVVLKTESELAGKIDMYLIGENVRVPVELVWRHGAEAGLKFLKPLSWLEKA